jgi:hypothetical protein
MELGPLRARLYAARCPVFVTRPRSGPGDYSWSLPGAELLICESVGARLMIFERSYSGGRISAFLHGQQNPAHAWLASTQATNSARIPLSG